MAMQTFDDELDDNTTPKPQAQPAQAAQTAAAAAPATAATPKATQPAAKQTATPVEDESPSPKKAEDENLDTDFDDEKVYARPGQLNQCRPDKGKAARFAFLPKEWIAPQTAKSHFVETGAGKEAKKGRYRCLTPMGPTPTKGTAA